MNLLSIYVITTNRITNYEIVNSKNNLKNN